MLHIIYLFVNVESTDPAEINATFFALIAIG
jgi:hypothetical protein